MLYYLLSNLTSYFVPSYKKGGFLLDTYLMIDPQNGGPPLVSQMGEKYKVSIDSRQCFTNNTTSAWINDGQAWKTDLFVWYALTKEFIRTIEWSSSTTYFFIRSISWKQYDENDFHFALSQLK